jgi:hypothetical protein
MRDLKAAVRVVAGLAGRSEGLAAGSRPGHCSNEVGAVHSRTHPTVGRVRRDVGGRSTIFGAILARCRWRLGGRTLRSVLWRAG